MIPNLIVVVCGFSFRYKKNWSGKTCDGSRQNVPDRIWGSSDDIREGVFPCWSRSASLYTVQGR